MVQVVLSIETIDTPDVSLLTQINNNFNILIYLLSVCIGLVFAFAICFIECIK